MRLILNDIQATGNFQCVSCRLLYLVEDALTTHFLISYGDAKVMMTTPKREREPSNNNKMPAGNQVNMNWTRSRDLRATFWPIWTVSIVTMAAVYSDSYKLYFGPACIAG